MSQMLNLEAYLDAQFQTAREQFEASSDYAYEGQILRLLEEPAIPSTMRVACCFMMAKNPQNADFYHKEGIRVLAQIEDMIEKEQVGARLKPWVERARTNFKELEAHIREFQLEADVTGQDFGGATIPEQAEKSEVREEMEKTITVARADDEDEESASSVLQSQDPKYASTISGIPYRGVSTEQTSHTGESATVVEGNKSPPTHPAIQQMEDDLEMLFGDHTDYENWTREEQLAWKAAAPERLREKMLAEEKATVPAKKDDKDDKELPKEE